MASARYTYLTLSNISVSYKSYPMDILFHPNMLLEYLRNFQA